MEGRKVGQKDSMREEDVGETRQENDSAAPSDLEATWVWRLRMTPDSQQGKWNLMPHLHKLNSAKNINELRGGFFFFFAIFR